MRTNTASSTPRRRTNTSLSRLTRLKTTLTSANFGSRERDPLKLRRLFDSKCALLLWLSLTLIPVITCVHYAYFTADLWPLELIDNRWGGFADVEICEVQVRTRFAQLRVNSISSMAYGIVGAFVLCLYVLDDRKSKTFEARFGNQPASLVLRQPGWSFLVGSSLCVWNVGSFVRFSSVSAKGEEFESIAQWATLLSLVAVSIVRLVDPPRKLRLSRSKATLVSYVFILTVVSLDVAMGLRAEAFSLNITLFAVLGGTGLIPVLISAKLNSKTISNRWPMAWFSAVFLGLGFAFKRMDENGRICVSPESAFQGTAFWNACSALSALFAYLFFRADQWSSELDDLPSLREIANKVLAIGNFSALAQRHWNEEERIRRLAGDDDDDDDDDDDERSAESDSDSPLAVNENEYYDGNDRKLRRKPTMSTVFFAPQEVLTQAQIRAIEFVLGLSITAAIVAVLVVAFLSD